MLITICGWYTFIILILGTMITIAKDGRSITEYTGRYKLIEFILKLPMYYYLFTTLFV